MATTPILSDHHRSASPAAISEANAFATGTGAVAPLVVGAAVALGLGWRAGVLVTLLGIAFVLFLGRGVTVPDQVHAAEESVGARRLPRSFWPAWAILVLCIGVEFSVTIWSSDLLRQRLGVSEAAAAASLTVVIVGMTLGRLVGARLMLVQSLETLLLAALGVAAVGFVIVWTAPALWVAGLGLFVLGFGMGAHYPLSISRAVAASDSQPDVASARASIGAGLAVGVAPILLGRLADSYGTHTAFLLVPVLLSTAAVILLTTASPLRQGTDGLRSSRSWKGQRMKAMVQRRYGAPKDVLQLAEIDIPAVRDEDVLVRVRASSANPWDWHYIRGEPVLMRPAIGGVRRPKFLVPGGDLAGTVERIGKDVIGFVTGDPVYGFRHGAFAEYVAVPQSSLARKPENLTFEQAAAVPLGAATAIQGLRAGRLQPGQHVLIIGASGGVGTFAVQLAKHMGAEVTGVCSSVNVELVRSLGADHVIDYTTQAISAGLARYDLILQLGGTYSPALLRRVLTAEGTLIQSFGDGSRWLGPLGNIIQAAAMNRFVGQTLRSFTAEVETE